MRLKCNSCLQEIEGSNADAIIGLCQSCQDKFDELIEQQNQEDYKRSDFL